MPANRYLQRTFEIYQWQGPLGLAVRALALTGCRVLHVYSLRDLSVANKDAGNGASIDIGEVPEDDLTDYLQFRRGATPEQFRARAATHCHCHAARVGSGIVSATWVATREAKLAEFGETLVLRRKQVYLFDSYTLPDYRGQKIQGRIFAAIKTHYYSLGYREVLVLTGPENSANIASRTRQGFRKTGGIAQFKIGPFRRHFSWGERNY